MDKTESSKPNPLLGIFALLLGAIIGYLWKGTFLAIWLGGLIAFIIVGFLWAFGPPIINALRRR